MLKNILFFFFVCSAISMSAQEWMTSFDIAKRLAMVQDKMLFVMWEESTEYEFPVVFNNTEGHKVYTDLFEDERVNQAIWEYFIPVKLPETSYEVLFNKIKDTRSSRYIEKFQDDSIKIMDVNGNILNTIDVTSYEFNITSFIKKYRLNTSYLKQELVNYSKKKNFTTSFNLAKKYLDYAILSHKEPRKEIIALSRIYFDEAKRILASDTMETKEWFPQKVELLRIKEQLILNQPRKSRRQLKKIDENNILKVNQSLYAFLQYTTFKLLKDDINAGQWESKLSLVDLKKAELIIKNNKK